MMRNTLTSTLPCLLLLFLLLCDPPAAFAQTKSPITSQDSIQITAVWKDFLSALEKNDKQAIFKMSLPNVYCDLCGDEIDLDEDYVTPFIPIDVFYDEVNRFFLDSPEYRAIKKSGVRYVVSHPSASETLIEVTVTTFEPKQRSPSDTGHADAFQFLKTKNGLKFYGLVWAVDDL